MKILSAAALRYGNGNPFAAGDVIGRPVYVPGTKVLGLVTEAREDGTVIIDMPDGSYVDTDISAIVEE